MASTDVTFIADKDREYQLYLIWRSLPRDIDATLFEKLGVSDETILELSKIRTQKELSKHIGVSTKTISDWKKREVPEKYRELDWRYWAKDMTPSVMSAFLRNIRKNGRGADVAVWMRYVEQIEDKTTVKHEGLDPIFESIKAIAERHGPSSS